MGKRAVLATLTVALLVAGTLLVVFLPSIGRIWPLISHQPTNLRYNILAAPDTMPRPRAMGPSLVRLNQAGQVLSYSGSRSMLWTPAGIDGPDSRLVDFNALFNPSTPNDAAETTTVIASAINTYGQVAGIAEYRPQGQSMQSAAFLWTPSHAHGSEGGITYLTQPPTQNIIGFVWGLNDWGQVAIHWGEEALLWTPDSANDAHGSVQSLSAPATVKGCDSFP
jgi:hypothetical protein